MSNVYAARAALPGMLARGHGDFLQTSSAGGLLTEVGSAAYSVTKHALTVEDVAECVVQGLAEEKFLILPHPEVADFFAAKPTDYDRWLHQFSRMKEK